MVNKLVSISGIVTKCSLVRPKILKSVHYCDATKQIHQREYRDATSFSGLPTGSTYMTRDDDGNVLTTEYGLCEYTDSQVSPASSSLFLFPLPFSSDPLCSLSLSLAAALLLCCSLLWCSLAAAAASSGARQHRRCICKRCQSTRRSGSSRAPSTSSSATTSSTRSARLFLVLFLFVLVLFLSFFLFLCLSWLLSLPRPLSSALLRRSVAPLVPC